MAAGAAGQGEGGGGGGRAGRQGGAGRLTVAMGVGRGHAAKPLQLLQ